MQLLPDPPTNDGAIAQLGERLLCKQEVTGSIPVGSTSPPVLPAKARKVCDARCMRPCRSLKIWKILLIDAKFSSECFLYSLENVAFA